MSDLATHFNRLSTLLARHRGDWQRLPFACRTLPWPELTPVLETLSEAKLDALEADPKSALALLAPHRPEMVAVQHWPVPELHRAHDYATPRWSSGIPGRKWAQIRDFAANISATHPILEWCAGKGHLGRLLSLEQQQAVTSLEWSAALCQQGEALAGKLGLDHRFHCGDALAPEAAGLFKRQQQAVALHACGELHLRFLRHGAAAGTQALALSPCCYHLIDGEHYAPLSAAGQQAGLRLSRHDLRLPLQQQVTGGERVRRLRHTELTWRLAFDELQRELTGENSYLPLPAFPKQLLSGDFAAFARWACEKKGLARPASLNSEHWLALADARRLLVKRIELVRHLYRQPLELWLLLDRALYLEEQGYRVTLGTFTEQANTPRRYLIQAHRP
ncbi:methyltransferase [Oceanimonas sp. CHS3-5]|uniref:methyltransferase n=1 Tax=Oceanimonas sp. CHS3-5 TaxID=3068186 RepID=UPI00273F4706|nr:methyltransferase [Oceanimonas sp. CHS3-5]MDP5292872.1 methyltransferase [Oceanimonas sp. CHS3-5]